jgi:proline iminopeptidase
MYLDVGDGHRMYYEEHGNPKGSPVVVLHGGPGGGLQRSVLGLFNLKRWRVFVYDQRGCGRSTPRLSLTANTTWHLVADIERLREHMGIARWSVFGGSWGSTLALAYASRHVDHIAALVLRGVCLMEPWENKWLYEEGGASTMFPKEWAAFSRGRRRGLVKTYRRALRNRRTRRAAAKAWWGWEAALSTLRPSVDKTPIKQVEDLATFENHYFSHNAWIRPGELLKAARRIPSSIPVHIVQGRYDMVCPATSAFALADAIPHARLTVTIAGHAASEPETAAALRAATDSLVRA